MSIRSGQAVTHLFETSNPSTHAAVDADSLPVGTLYVNGVSDAASVAVTNLSTGLYSAAVTLPALSIGDIAEIVIAATVATVAKKFIAWRDTADIAVDAAGGVTLADGVAHGGTPGSSTATLALQQLNLHNSSAEGMIVVSDIANAMRIAGHNAGDGATSVYLGGGDAAIMLYGSNVAGGLLIAGPWETPGPAIVIDATANLSGVDGGPGIQIRTGDGHGIDILTAGTGSKALLLAGDAATDSLAIAAGAGSPVDVFAADGSVTAALGAAGTDWLTAVAVSSGAVDKIQAGLATPTNITAGTITNLTNAPTAGDLTAAMKASVTTAATAATPTVTAGVVSDKTGYSLTIAPPTAAAITSAVLNTQMTESYNADGVAPTLAQAAFVIMQRLTEFGISGASITVRKLDGSQAAYTLTMDSPTSPTSATRAS